MKKVLVLDHGNGNVKIRSLMHQSVKPSLLAFKKDIGHDFSGKQLSLSTYEVDNIAYVWGEDVQGVKEVYPTYGFQNRYKDTMYRTLTKIAVADLAKRSFVQSHDEVILITGAPSGEIDTSAITDLEAAFTGPHEVIVNGRKQKVNVSQVIVLPQPIGTVMSRYLDEEGYVADERYEVIRVGVIDIGMGTTDLDSISCLRREEYKSIEAGMKDVYQLIADYVNKENPNAKAEFYHIEPQFASGKYKISERHSIDFSSIRDTAVFEVAEKIKKGIKNAWKTFDRFDEIILTGGGAELFAPYIGELVGELVIADQPQEANANGYLRYGLYKIMED